MGEKQKLLEQAEAIYRQWAEFSNLLGSADGKTLRKIAQSYLLGELLGSANGYLRQFNDRYELESNPGTLTILVRDLLQGDRTAVTTLSGGDITHAVPDNTGYITEGQLYLRRDSDIGKVIVDPFRSLSRLKQLVAGKKTRKDHSQVMNAAIRLYADAANAKTKLENGFDLTDYDNRCLDFAKEYADKLLAIDVNLNTEEMLDVTWGLFRKYFKLEEVNIKKEFTDMYWK
jgi:hypothetical protein